MNSEPDTAATLLDMLDAPPLAYVLWFRPSARRPWEMLGSADTEREAWRLIDRAGDFLVLPRSTSP